MNKLIFRNSWIHNQDSSNSIGVLSNESGSNHLNWSPQIHKRFERLFDLLCNL